MEIFHAEPDTPEVDELGLLLVLIKNYEDNHDPIPKLDTLDVMKVKASEMWEKLFTWISKKREKQFQILSSEA